MFNNISPKRFIRNSGKMYEMLYDRLKNIDLSREWFRIGNQMRVPEKEWIINLRKKIESEEKNRVL